MTKATTKLERITPEIASAMLASNTRNRVLVPRRVESIAADIRAGLWRVTHQGIAVMSDGTLGDGQHRLAAIVAAGVPVMILVTRGLPVEAIDAIDTGRSRRADDVLAIADGIRMHSSQRAALFVAHTLARVGSLSSTYVSFDVHSLRSAIAEHGADLDVVLDGLGKAHDKLTTAALVGSLAICARTEPEKVRSLSAEIRSGANLPVGSPALALRRYTLERQNHTGNAARESLSLAVFSAVDAYVRGQSRGKLMPAPNVRARYLLPWRSED